MIPQQLTADLHEYLEKEPNLRRDDRLAYLSAIFQKHFTVSKLDHIINSDDMFRVISDAKSAYMQTRLPMFVSKKAVTGNDLSQVLIISAFVQYLNRNELLKKNVLFDVTGEK